MMKLMTSLMPSCREVTGLLASDGELSAPWMKRLLVRVHLSMCVHCSRFARQLAVIAQAVRVVWAPVPASETGELRRRIVDRLKSL